MVDWIEYVLYQLGNGVYRLYLSIKRVEYTHLASHSKY